MTAIVDQQRERRDAQLEALLAAAHSPPQPDFYINVYRSRRTGKLAWGARYGNREIAARKSLRGCDRLHLLHVTLKRPE